MDKPSSDFPQAHNVRSYTCFDLAKYARAYDPPQLSLDKTVDSRFAVNATYTWPNSRGYGRRLCERTLQQEDAGLTQGFNFGSFTDGSKGFLPNDRRHVIKAYGAYKVAEDWRVWAAAGFEDTLLRWNPKPEVGYGNETAVQPGVQA